MLKCLEIEYNIKLDRDIIWYKHDKHLLYYEFDGHMITNKISIFYHIYCWVCLEISNSEDQKTMIRGTVDSAYCA
jgi:hypothetical protein